MSVHYKWQLLTLFSNNSIGIAKEKPRANNDPNLLYRKSYENKILLSKVEGLKTISDANMFYEGHCT